MCTSFFLLNQYIYVYTNIDIYIYIYIFIYTVYVFIVVDTMHAPHALVAHIFSSLPSTLPPPHIITAGTSDADLASWVG